jgi:small-conductance mechanosensitive channel
VSRNLHHSFHVLHDALKIHIDGLETIVPNALISSQKVTNVSRIKTSQVKQIIRIRYEDADKIQNIMKDIKEEIRISCPKLIQDNKIRPFRVYWTDYKNDHLEVMIDTHYMIPPMSDEYFKNREQVLFAILRAVQKNHVQLQHYDRSPMPLLDSK